jgi:hypothetical protein
MAKNMTPVTLMMDKVGENSQVCYVPIFLSIISNVAL